MITESNGLTYVTLSVSEINQLDFNQILQTSAETLRLSIDGLSTIVKWNTGDGVPPCIDGLTTKSPYMTYDEAIDLMSTPEWTKNGPGV